MSPFLFPRLNHQLLMGCLATLYFCGLAPSAEAQSSAETSAALPQADAVFVPPTGDRQSDSSAGGTRRLVQRCRQDPPERLGLTALAPENYVGLTVQEQPVVFVYVPETSAQQLYVSLKALDGEERYEEIVSLQTSSAVMALRLPLEQEQLPQEQTYRWGVGLLCASGQTDMPWDYGYIRRVEGEATLPSEVSAERLRALGAQGLWYDTVATVMQAHQRPQLQGQTVFQKAWVQLLSWAELEHFPSQLPLLDVEW